MPVTWVSAGQRAQHQQPRHETQLGGLFSGRDKLVHLIEAGEVVSGGRRQSVSFTLHKMGLTFLILFGSAKFFWINNSVDPCEHIPTASAPHDARLRISDRDVMAENGIGGFSVSRQVHVQDLLCSRFFVSQNERSEQCPVYFLIKFVVRNMLVKKLQKAPLLVLLKPNAFLFGSECLAALDPESFSDMAFLLTRSSFQIRSRIRWIRTPKLVTFCDLDRTARETSRRRSESDVQGRPQSRPQSPTQSLRSTRGKTPSWRMRLHVHPRVDALGREAFKFQMANRCHRI